MSKKKICMRTAAPFSELTEALNSLNNTETPRFQEENCQRSSRHPAMLLHQKTRNRYLDHIKDAMLKQNWEMTYHLLSAYMKDPQVTATGRTYLLNALLVFLANDEIAKSRDRLRDFLKLALNCGNEEDRKMLLKRTMTFKRNERESED